jgi:hypothetical protein
MRISPDAMKTQAILIGGGHDSCRYFPIMAKITPAIEKFALPFGEIRD